VVYSGSLERIDFGEEGDPKGFCWVELAHGAVDWRFVRLDARPLVTLRADLRQSADPTADMLQMVRDHDLQGAVVRVLIDIAPENETRLNESVVREALRQADVYHLAGIRKTVERPERARLGANPEGLTPEQLLERYLISREVPEDRRTELLTAAQSIFEQ
jgi:DNA repair protein SbcD/Mre11